MAQLKNYKGEDVRVVDVELAASTATWTVGQGFSLTAGVAAAVADASLVAGNYILAMSDAEFNGAATSYKTYTLPNTVAMSTESKKVAAILIRDETELV